jgi:DNA-binding NarL/FixJ family response regulator
MMHGKGTARMPHLRQGPRRASVRFEPPGPGACWTASDVEHAQDRPTRVLIADDDPMMIEALADLVASRPFLLLVGVAADGAQAIALACRERPDVALLDVRMPGGGPETARGIRACSPGTAIVALSAYRDRESMEGMRDAGTREYLVKGSATIDAIVSAIRGAAGGC